MQPLHLLYSLSSLVPGRVQYPLDKLGLAQSRLLVVFLRTLCSSIKMVLSFIYFFLPSLFASLVQFSPSFIFLSFCSVIPLSPLWG